MRGPGCAAVRRRLQGASDGELPGHQQMEVLAHLERCEHCAAAMDDLLAVREAFQASGLTRPVWTNEEQTAFRSSVVSRAVAERDVSWGAWFREALRESPLLYAGVGALGATVTCVLIMSSMMRFAELVVPGSNVNPVVVDARMLMPRVIYNGFDPAAGARVDDEAAYTLSAVVTREGRLVNLELHPEGGHAPAAGSREAQVVESMLGAIAQARFAPARVGGLPIAVNMVWLVERTTVHAASFPGEAAPVQPPVKKRRVVVPVVVSAARPATVA
jgi:hypothetical protein